MRGMGDNKREKKEKAGKIWRENEDSSEYR
jgi:hypothetical protein